MPGRFRKHPWRCLFAAAAVALVVFFVYRDYQVRRGDALVKRLWDATSPEERTAVREEIAQLRNATAIYRVVLALKVANNKIQADAMEGLIAIGPAAIAPLEKLLSERSYRWDNLLRSLNVDAAFRAVLASDRNTFRLGRANAAVALGRIGDASAVDVLIEALGDRDDTVVGNAAWALGAIGDPRAIEPLWKLLASGRFAPAAQRPLASFGASAVPCIAKQLHSPGTVNSYDAAYALASMGSLGVEELVRELEKPRYSTPPYIFDAVGNIRDERFAEPLIRLLKSDNVEMRKSAARALGSSGGYKSAVPLLLEMLENPSEDAAARRLAARALANFPDERVVIALINVAGESDENLRSAAVFALGRTGDARAADTLLAALDDTSADVARAAAAAAGGIDDERITKRLLEILHDFDYTDENAIEILRGAIGSLDAIGDSRAVEPLIEALDSPAPREVKDAAARALGDIGDKRAVEPLIAVLRNGDGSPKGTVARALGKIGDPRAVKPLIDALYFSLGYYADSTVVEALVRLGDKEALPALRHASDRCVGHPYNWETVQEAIEQIEGQQPSGR